MPGLVARIAAGTREASAGVAPDSIYVVLNPEAPAHAIRLAGVITDDAVRGVWAAESPLGGGGSFVWRRATARALASP